MSVEPCIQAGVYTFKVEISTGSVLFDLVLELGYLAAAGVFIGNIGGICGERVANVGVVVLIITVILPNTGNRNGVIVNRVKSGCIEQIGQIVDIGIILELPIPVE